MGAAKETGQPGAVCKLVLAASSRPTLIPTVHRFLNHCASKLVQVNSFRLGTGIAAEGNNVGGIW